MALHSEQNWVPGALQVLDNLNHDVIEIPSHSDTGLELEANISIAPGTTFSLKKQYGNYLRPGWGGHWKEGVENGIRTLGDLCKKQVIFRHGFLSYTMKNK